MSLQDRAAAAASTVARRLRDPDQVTERLMTGRTGAAAGRRARGAAGIALLYAELARHDAAYRPALRAWLSAAVQDAERTAGEGLYAPVPALVFALDRAAADRDDHRAARDHLHAQARVLTERTLAREDQRLRGGGECPLIQTYDVVSGLAGAGVLLLDHYETAGADDAVRLLRRLLAVLVRLTRPQRVDGAEFPGLWVAQNSVGHERVPVRRGHVNLGLAHGIPGPLALLALAWRAGVRVNGQEEAITVLAGTLLGLARDDESGPWWPHTAGAGPDSPGGTGPGRPSWCYGTPGIARALQLAGLALGVTAWQGYAETAVLAAIARDARVPMTEAGLCHGRAGLLHVCARIAGDALDARVPAQIPALTERTLGLADPGEEFGVAPPPADAGGFAESASFLTGAAGTALALHSAAAGQPPATSWDRMLLLC